MKKIQLILIVMLVIVSCSFKKKSINEQDLSLVSYGETKIDFEKRNDVSSSDSANVVIGNKNFKSYKYLMVSYTRKPKIKVVEGQSGSPAKNIRSANLDLVMSELWFTYSNDSLVYFGKINDYLNSGKPEFFELGVQLMKK